MTKRCKYFASSIVIKKNLGIPVEYYDISQDKLAGKEEIIIDARFT